MLRDQGRGQPIRALLLLFSIFILDLWLPLGLPQARADGSLSRFPLEKIATQAQSITALRQLSPEAKQELLNLTDQFVKFRNNQLKPEEMAAFISSCLSHPKQNPFCEVFQLKSVDEEIAPPREATQRDVGFVDSKEIEEEEEVVTGAAGIKKALLEANWKGLKNFKRKEIYRVVSKLGPQLDTVVAPILADQAACPPTSITLSLALAVEDRLPDPVARQQTRDLYERVTRCGPEFSRLKAVDPEMSLSRYRQAMFWLWEDRCDQANPILTVLSEEKEGNFVSRALFWRVRCAEKRGDKLQAEVLRSVLFKNNPLGFHTLLAHRYRLQDLANQIFQNSSHVILESQVDPRLSVLALTVELLIQKKEDKLAREILYSMGQALDRVEPEFQLYVSVLATFANAHIFPFQVMSKVYKSDPRQVSPQSLQYFYPLEFFPMLKSHAASLDPYLLAALIRQESGFNTGAKSRVGALGLMQLMPRTARLFGKVSKRALLNPATNIQVGARFFRSLVKKFKGDVELALAAYNAGPGKVDEWVRRYPVEDRVLFLDLIPFTETRDYVALISRNYFWYTHLYTSSAFLFTTQVERAHLAQSVFKSFEAVSDRKLASPPSVGFGPRDP